MTGQNSTFEDLYMLAEHRTWKRKYLFCLGTQNALKFRPSAPLHPTSLILTAFPVHPLGDRWLQSPAAGELTPVVFPPHILVLVETGRRGRQPLDSAAVGRV